MSTGTSMQISTGADPFSEAKFTSFETTQVQRVSAVQVQIKLSTNFPMPPAHISTCIFALCHNFFDI